MARARNIKPSFFTNEQVADNCPLGRLLFIGMWTYADYKGDLEWKERTLKIQILPWDNCDLKELAITLDKSGLIRFYSDGNKIYVNIPNFEKHQNPHKNEREKGSDIPAYSDGYRQLIDLQGLTINRDLSGLKPESSQSDRADSLLLIPDSLKPPTDSIGASTSDADEKNESGNSQPDKQKKSKPPRAGPDLDYSGWGEVDQQVFSDWIELRKSKKAKITQTVIDGFLIEFRKAAHFGYSVTDCLRCVVVSGWQGFKFEWMQNQQGVNRDAANQQRHGAGASIGKISHSDQVRADAREALERLHGSDGNSAVCSTG